MGLGGGGGGKGGERGERGGGNYEKVKFTHRDLDHTYRELSVARATLVESGY